MSAFLRNCAALLLTSVLFLQPLLGVDTQAQTDKSDNYYEPLPQEQGTNGLKLMLRKLGTTGRLMQVTAHPDDEDGGMLTLEARGKGVTTVLMTLTRGEGGQNKLGSNLFDVLGVLRTLELLASDRYYGVEQRFSRVADFGYSKTAEETFQKWQGHDVALGDLVRVIRTFRPDVLIARFSGTDRDGHGHHQASSILTQEAFRAAGDPLRFPEQLNEGLQPWQPKKLYSGNVCGFFAPNCDPSNYTVRLNTGTKDPLLGTSYIQFALRGLRHQQSQGSGTWTVEDGDRYTYYKLLDSVVDSPKDKDGHEQDFFDGIDTTLPGLASRLGKEEEKVPWLREKLAEIQAQLKQAQSAVERNPSAVEAPLSSASGMTVRLYNQILGSQLSQLSKSEFQVALLETLWPNIKKARSFARGANFRVLVDAPVGTSPENAFMAVPGQPFEVTARFSTTNGSDRADMVLNVPDGWKTEVLNKETSGAEQVVHFRVTPPMDASPTRPYWHRNDPETESLNIIDDPKFQNFPFPPPPITASARLKFGPLVTTTCMVQYQDASHNVSLRPLAVGPAFSVTLVPSEQVLSATDGPAVRGKIDSTTNLQFSKETGTKGADSAQPRSAVLRPALPDGWHADPSEKSVTFRERGEEQTLSFTVVPADRREERTAIRADLTNERQKYDEGYTVVTRDDLGTAYYYQPAIQRVSIVDVKVPKDLKVGYIMGAGDEIPTVLQQIGLDVTLLPPDKLATEDLSKFQTIVLGIRAYDTQKDVIANNKKLLDYVEAGGRLVVQYNASTSEFNSGKFTPYPATLSRARVSVEEAPVKILDPSNPIFHSPNEITQKDFEGWVQERGLYFMSQWDSKFTPLLETHDPKEEEQKGGLMIAQYGKGTYIYTGYAFFRQLPAGVPGAVRLFVNLLGSR